MIDDCRFLIKKSQEFCLISLNNNFNTEITARRLTFVSPQWLGVTLELRRTGGGGLTVLTDDLRAILEAPGVAMNCGG